MAVVFATYRDYGISWDEPIQTRFGEGVLRYFTSGCEDRSVNDLHLMRFYGPLFELGAAVACAGNHDHGFETRHLLIAVTALLAVLGTARLAKRVAGTGVAVLVVLILVTLPRFYGHAFVNSKDIPFACGFVWSMVTLCTMAVEGMRPRRMLPYATALGVTLAVRPGGLPLLLLVYGAVTALAAWSRGGGFRRRIVPFALRSFLIWGIAWGLMVAPWPWAHESPLGNPVRAIAAAWSYPDRFPTMFEGHVTISDALPRYYLVKFMAITTPPLVLFLASVGLFRGVVRQFRAPASPEAVVVFATQVWLLVPLLGATIGRPNVYDGVRHFLFVLPALALFAGFGAGTAVDLFGVPWKRRTAFVTAALACAIPVISLVRLHPYEMTYFNILVGGVRGASGRYETDYWLLSYREAAEWVNGQVEKDRRAAARVIVAADQYSADCARKFLDPRIEMSLMSLERGVPKVLPRGVDYYIATTRYGNHLIYGGSPVVHRIGRAGGVFTVIRARVPRSDGR